MTVLSQLFTDVSEVPGEDDFSSWALAYARAGVSVFPAHGVRWTSWIAESGEVTSGWACTCARGVLCANPGKHPVGGLVPRGHLDAVRNHMTIKSWFKPGSQWNIGLATGNGLVVVDVDTKPDHEGQTGLDTVGMWENWSGGWSLPAGLRQRTGSGGIHIWMRVPSGAHVPGGNRVLPGIDVKGDGGYVIAAPSRHVKGSRYGLVIEGSWTDTVPEVVGQPLTFLMGLKGGKYRSIRTKGLGGSGEAGGGLAAEFEGYSFADQLRDGCKAGNRDVFFNDLAFRLRKKDVSLDDAAQTMRAAWSKAERPTDSFGNVDDFAWDDILYKLNRVYTEVSVTTTDDLPAWRPPTARAAAMEEIRDFVIDDVEDLQNLALNAPVVTGEALSFNAVMGTRPELTLHETDTGNGERFAKRMREAVRYLPDLGRWYAWNGKTWSLDHGGSTAMLLTKEIIKDFYEEALTCVCERNEDGSCRHSRHAHKTESAAARTAMLRSAQSEPEMQANADTWDTDPWLLVVKNGTLDLRTGQLRESRSTDYNTKCAGVAWSTEQWATPRWNAFLEFFTAGDGAMAAYLQRLAGYCLTGSIKEQKFMFFEGTGANGKNVFIETLLGVMGNYGKVGTTQLITGSDQDHPTVLADLQGARLVFVDEAKANRQLNVERLKSLTAPEISARKMKQDFYVFTNQVKLFIAGNNHPTIKDSSDGTWRRLQRIMCVGKIAEADKVKDLVEILLREEGPGILQWMMAGCLSWQQLGDLGVPVAVMAAVQEYRDEEDFIARFMEERYVVTGDEADFVANPDLYQSYQLWCALNGIGKFDILNSIKFGKIMTERYKLGSKTPRIDGKMTRVRTGIKVLES